MGRADRDHAGRTKETVAQLEAAAALMEHRSLGFSGSGLLPERFMQVGIEGLADSIDRGDAVVGEKAFELALDQFQTGNDRGDVLGGSGGLESEFQVIEQGKKV